MLNWTDFMASNKAPDFLIKSFLYETHRSGTRTITETIMSFDKDARLYLFGSRVDDKRKGGDIDLLVLTDKLTFADKLKIKARLWERLGEQKIDLLITDDESRPFVQIALEHAIRL